MSYKLNQNLSLSALRSLVVGIIAALEASSLNELAALWRALQETLSTLMAAQLADEDHEAVTTARVNVCNAAWDRSVGNLSKKARYLAGGDSDASPYAPLFGTVKAGDLMQLGPAKATVAAGVLLAKVETVGNPELAAAAQEVAARTEELSLAEKADAEAELKIASHGIERIKFLRQVETLIAETEAKLLTLHPGRADLVRAILSPNKDRRRSSRSEASETPVTPES